MAGKLLADFFTQLTSEKHQGNTRESLDWILREFLHKESGKKLEQATQGSGEVLIPEGIRDIWRWH